MPSAVISVLVLLLTSSFAHLVCNVEEQLAAALWMLLQPDMYSNISNASGEIILKSITTKMAQSHLSLGMMIYFLNFH